MRLLGVVESDTGRQTEASSESICICMEMSCLKSMVQIDSCKRQDPIGVASHTRTDSFCWVLGRKGQSPKPPRGKMASYYPLPAVVPVPACLPTDTTAQLHKTFPYITTSSDAGFRAQRTSIPDLTKHPQASFSSYFIPINTTGACFTGKLCVRYQFCHAHGSADLMATGHSVTGDDCEMWGHGVRIRAMDGGQMR
jgi:hypothetical protein